MATELYDNFPDLRRLGLAVSGGSDSMALLDLTRRWAETRDVSIVVATVDHGLRPEAAEEARHVAEHCASRGIGHHVLTWSGWDGTGNLQAEARKARFRLLAEWADVQNLDGVALGHTQDDQAETFLMRLVRKAGVDGLGGMRPVVERHGMRFLRPLLSMSRTQLRSHLAETGIGWKDDASNEDDRFDRVKIRKLLDVFETHGLQRDALAQASGRLAAASSALDHYTLMEAKSHLREDRGDLILTGAGDLPQEIARRLLIATLRSVGGEDYPPRETSLIHLEQSLKMSGKGTLTGCLVVRDGEDVRVTREYAALAHTRCPTDEIWDGRWRLTGPHDPAFHVRALGESGLLQCEDWRATEMPRASLLASPSVWQQDRLIAAPIAGLGDVWSAELVRSVFDELSAFRGSSLSAGSY